MPVAIIMTQGQDDLDPDPVPGQRLVHQGPAFLHTPHASSPLPQQITICVDTIITDSNGNTSRYDSSEHISGFSSSRNSKSLGSSPAPRRTELGLAPSVLDVPDSRSDLSMDNSNVDRTALGREGTAGAEGGSFSVHSHSNSGGSKLASPGRSPSGSGPGSPAVDGARSRPRTGRRYSATCSTSPHHSSHSLMSQDAGHLPVPTLALTPDRIAPNGHHTRASSFRESKSGGRKQLTVDEGVMGQIRRNSMPNVTNNLLHVPGASSASASANSNDLGENKDNRIRRVRSFKTTSKGVIVNRGDSFKKKSTHSLMSTGSTVTDNEARARASSNSNSLLDAGGEGFGPAPPAYFRVYMMGAAGVGKTFMAHQFLTSEYVDHEDTDETHQMTVTVLLDGEESTIEFIDPPDRNVITEGLEQLLDAYVVVFAINDHDSFDTAQQLVRYLRVDYGTDRAILLVANKIDLVRKRKVTADEARLVATTFDCKYAETSAALNHHVDELLVGIITQIRLQLSIPFTTIFFPHKDAKRRKNKKALCKGPKGFFSRLFKRGGSQSAKKDKGVDNLLY